MIRVIKPEGMGNIQLEDTPIPEINSCQVLVRTSKTLISRGSELFRRYILEEAVAPSIMGYSLTGTIEQVGSEVTEYRAGQRVMVVAPHAQYAVGEVDSSKGNVVPLTENVSFEEGTFLPLARSATAWVDSSGVKAGDQVVVLGQGVVGSLIMQLLRGCQPEQIITVDTLPLRCQLSQKLGADEVINASEVDPVEAVKQLTKGRGADLVIDCVGGYAGVKSFEQAQDMVAQRGTIQLIALYQQQPLPLHASKIMQKRLVAGILTDESPVQIAQRALSSIEQGMIQIQPMITHLFPYTEAKEAFDLLWHTPEKTLGVLLDWQP
ncbi:MAG: zinc-binding dehydrogenase [Candidatus Poribacteria bacterium]|nr:zinc-binding dehydrogenase [Candidatus Poribacteria bacterium]MDP6748009.1 zinc-binding dehydrogenase [Candidatus Poribacteria bacterium]MDP6998358.1 zinc-binding dehydrogenase [Candidatus Poribacteria bacterium]